MGSTFFKTKAEGGIGEGRCGNEDEKWVLEVVTKFIQVTK